MQSELLIQFIFASIALAVSPGPDNLYVLTESISKGWKTGVAITTGLMSGVLIHTSIVATGMGLLIIQAPILLNMVKLAGAAYLVFLAVKAWNESLQNNLLESQSSNRNTVQLIARGFVMNVLNPKVTLFFLALLPQFVSNDDWNPAWQMMVLGGVFMLVSFIVFSSVAVLGAKAARLIEKKWFQLLAKWLKIVVLIALAVLLLISYQ